ncbi:bifunctional phosphoribosyl-AMP cyclohydrolase/phosphoribosyl-ATP diphosphatase [Candidatus Palibaumannia cicadellinicola]|uniref:Histidine biosynthesis bifunctional protein HisIE n=1 Tax=Candidatus Palibaumannia cicadellinicola TaxID=186490 RepID=A0A2N4XW68_9GAMM|nr:bifunctional phosphoribosyl-AMP cyclohydrolase/phosphoribosyl-ATP diphosphatase HisIE [Candidatus Baumannia cicadellinicola]PLK58208.1 bifunctional phosphoribosyl-AMP cyclohydrolase/phosphoribosyl-ATP diphosphatase [Candidatus Baumannia cicadellinicola]
MLTEKQPQGLNWQKTNGIMPAIIQHSVSGEVLMMGYMNTDALKVTEQTGHVTFYSRSKQRLWTKGESSGNVLQVISLHPDCDNDTLLILAYPLGPTCHNGARSCFHPAVSDWGFLYHLEILLRERKIADPKSSYTARLYSSSTKRIAQKVGEEGLETALAGTVQDQEELINEAADLVYHLLVLLLDQTLDFSKVIAKLRERHLSATNKLLPC